MKISNEEKKRYEFVDFVRYNGKTYKTRQIKLKSYGWSTIGPVSLKDEVYKDDMYASDEAHCIDDSIFYYVKDAFINRYTTAELVALVEKEVA